MWSLFFSKHHKRISFSFLLWHLWVQGWNNTEQINFLDRITQANKMQTEKKNSFLFSCQYNNLHIVTQSPSQGHLPPASATEIQEACFCSRNESKTLYIYKSDRLKSWHHYLFWSLYSCVLTEAHDVTMVKNRKIQHCSSQLQSKYRSDKSLFYNWTSYSAMLRVKSCNVKHNSESIFHYFASVNSN